MYPAVHIRVQMNSSYRKLQGYTYYLLKYDAILWISEHKKMVQFSLISYRIKMLCIDVSLLMITQIFSGLFFLGYLTR